MYIFDAEDMIKGYIQKNINFAILGIAGCGKSTCIKYLRDLGYSKVILLTPTQQLRTHHIHRFTSCVDDLSVLTYASVLERANFQSIAYEAEEKDILLDADIVILDEVFATEFSLINRVRKYLEDKGLQYIMLGDDRQSSALRQYSPKVVCKNLPIITLDKSLRGTEDNRVIIEALYESVGMLDSGEVIELSTVCELVKAYGGSVVKELPTDNAIQYGYYANRVERLLLQNITFDEKIFTGTVSYKENKDGEQVLSKAWAKAPIVSQDQKNLIQQIIGNKVPIATPLKTWSAVTCIGCEVDGDYGLVFGEYTKFEPKAIYTLLSRQLDISKVTIYVIPNNMLPEPFFAYKPQIKVINDDGFEKYYITKKPLRSIKADADKLGVPSTLNKKINVKITQRFFKELLDKAGKEYSLDTKAIYTERGTFRLGGKYENFSEIEKANYLKYLEETFGFKFAKEEVLEESARIEDKMPLMIGDILQSAPGLACDPTSLQFQKINREKTFVSFNTLSDPVIKNEPIQQSNKETDTEPLSTIDFDRLLSLEEINKSIHETYKLYKLDFVASYYQILTEYSEYIGYGELVQYDKNAKISYFLVRLQDDQVAILNTQHIKMYKKLGVTFKEKLPLGSRTGTLSDVMTESLKAQINYNRQIRFSKEEILLWGVYNKPRFVVSSYTDEEKNSVDCVTDFSLESCMFCMMKDIIATQYMLVYAVSKAQNSNCTVKVDAIESLSPLTLDLPKDWGIKRPDVTYTEILCKAAEKEILKEVKLAPNLVSSLQTKLDEIMENKKPSYKTKTTEKIRAKLDELRSKAV